MQSRRSPLPPKQPLAPLLWFAVVACIGLITVNYHPYMMAWDDANLMHRVVAVRTAVFSGDLAFLKRSLELVSKSPLFVCLGLVWGPLDYGVSVIGFTLFAATLLNWVLALGVLRVAAALKVPGWAMLGAGACLALNATAIAYAGSFLSDITLAWVVVVLVALIQLELEPQPLLSNYLIKGVVWGIVLSLGVLAKVTFGYFLILLGPALLLASWRRSGPRATLLAFASCCVASIPAITIWLFLGKQFLAHALRASWGPIAEYYATSQSDLGAQVARIGTNIGWQGIIWVILATIMIWRPPQHARWMLYCLAVSFGYLAVSFSSPNQDPRFWLPFTITVPCVLALGIRKESAYSPPGWVWCLGMVAVVVISAPVIARPRLDNVNAASSLVDLATERKSKRILLATDSGPINIETFLLALELKGNFSTRPEIETSAYDEINGQPSALSLSRLKRADLVIFQDPLPTEPAFTNTRSMDLLRVALESGTPVETGVPPGYKVFIIAH